uniref:BHLH transcription factor n=1 Tax=Lilium hybrid division I TaxID=156532 RepID=Q401N5_9LILI|nr:bHLH transcription factor [Lilium hybrid division I]
MELLQIENELPWRQFRKQLAATVRDIQWSYAIFWAFSTKQQGVLAWKDGYYNGEIKTRKTTQAVELEDEEMGLQRSEQLRELYGSLSFGDSNHQMKRPSASLSPEDLTDMEWYYVVCMSFTYRPGEWLPGKTLARNQYIWMSNAPSADTELFSRTLLAKSASVQTVVCFPFMGGALELGTSELVLEDPSLIQHVKTCLRETPTPVYSPTSISSSPVTGNGEDNLFPNLNPELVDTIFLDNHILMTECQTPVESYNPGLPFALPSPAPPEEAGLIQDKFDELCEELKFGSPDHSSNIFCPNQHADNTQIIEGINVASLDQGNQLMDNDLTAFCGSLEGGGCISETFLNTRLVPSSLKGERVQNNAVDYFREGDFTKLVSPDLNGGDSHYTRTLHDTLSNSKQLTSTPYFWSNSYESSFSAWKSDLSFPELLGNTYQKLLKKILMDDVGMNSDRSLKPQEDDRLKNKFPKIDVDDASASHVISERRRREKLNEKFLVLKSLVPSITKVDKASILGDTIEYLKELQRRIEELESCRKSVNHDPKGKRKHLDVIERTSDNYGSNKIGNCKRASAGKRKACAIEEAETEHQWTLMKDGPVHVNVTTTDKEAIVELHCPWRDCLLLKIVEAISNLHLDAHSVQSSITEGILALTLRAKHRRSVVTSTAMIRRALQSVISKCVDQESTSERYN